ncbi:hypothetical protein [Citrobacter portucalensis]
MTALNKQALREAAQEEIMLRSVSDTSDSWQDEASPEAVLALLDELEALKLANAAQDDHINQQQDRIDLLEKGNNEAAKQINSWRRLAKQNIAEREKDVSELNIARKQIAELEAREVVLPPLNDDLIAILGRPNFT